MRDGDATGLDGMFQLEMTSSLRDFEPAVRSQDAQDPTTAQHAFNHIRVWSEVAEFIFDDLQVLAKIHRDRFELFRQEPVCFG